MVITGISPVLHHSHFDQNFDPAQVQIDDSPAKVEVVDAQLPAGYSTTPIRPLLSVAILAPRLTVLKEGSSENGSVFTITRSKPPQTQGDYEWKNRPLTVRYRVVGTADRDDFKGDTSQLDHRAVDGTIVIPAGSTTAEIVVNLNVLQEGEPNQPQVFNDTISEPTETLSIVLQSSPDYYFADLGSRRATLFIEDNDPYSVRVGVLGESSVLEEGRDPETIFIERIGDLAGVKPLRLKFVGTATMGAQGDYSIVKQIVRVGSGFVIPPQNFPLPTHQGVEPLNFPERAAVTELVVRANADTDRDPGESFTATVEQFVNNQWSAVGLGSVHIGIVDRNISYGGVKLKVLPSERSLGAPSFGGQPMVEPVGGVAATAKLGKWEVTYGDGYSYSSWGGSMIALNQQPINFVFEVEGSAVYGRDYTFEVQPNGSVGSGYYSEPVHEIIQHDGNRFSLILSRGYKKDVPTSLVFIPHVITIVPRGDNMPEGVETLVIRGVDHGYILQKTTVVTHLVDSDASAGAASGFDTDHDGWSDAFELANGTDLLNPDEDGDGLPDGMSATGGLVDSDGDGIFDIDEERLRGRSTDSDADGRSDFFEVGRGTDPVVVGSGSDTTAPTITLTQPTSPNTPVLLTN